MHFLAPQAQLNVAFISPHHRLVSSFFTVGAALPESGLLTAGCVAPQSEWISTGSKVGRDLDDLYVVVHLG